MAVQTGGRSYMLNSTVYSDILSIPGSARKPWLRQYLTNGRSNFVKA